MNIINTAHAAANSSVQQGGGIAEIGMLVFFIALFYFLIWRPQSKRQKAHNELLNSLQKGDEVVTSGGVLGKVTSIKDNYVQLAIAKDIEITIQKFAVAQLLPKGTFKTLA